MALAVTAQAAAGDTSNTTGYASAAFTPTANALLIACFAASRGASTDPLLPTCAGGSLTWVQIADFMYQSIGLNRCRITIFAAQVSGSPSSMTVTATYGAALTGVAHSVFDVTGSDVANGVAQCAVQVVTTTANPVTNTTLSITLASASNANNRSFLFAVHAINESYTVDTANNWAEIGFGGHPTPPSALSTQWRNNAFDASVTTSWATTTTIFGGIAIEIKALAGTLYNSSPAGTLSFASGALTSRAGKALAGALSFASGALTRSSLKALAGTLSFASGALTRKANKALVGALSFASGTLSSFKVTLLSLAGTLSFSSGALTKRSIRALSGTLSFVSVTISQIKVILRNVTGTLSFSSGALTRRISKPLAGVLAFVGSLVGTLAGGLLFRGRRGSRGIQK